MSCEKQILENKEAIYALMDKMLCRFDSPCEQQEVHEYSEWLKEKLEEFLQENALVYAGVEVDEYTSRIKRICREIQALIVHAIEATHSPYKKQKYIQWLQEEFKRLQKNTSHLKEVI